MWKILNKLLISNIHAGTIEITKRFESHVFFLRAYIRMYFSFHDPPNSTFESDIQSRARRRGGVAGIERDLCILRGPRTHSSNFTSQTSSRFREAFHSPWVYLYSGFIVFIKSNHWFDALVFLDSAASTPRTNPGRFEWIAFIIFRERNESFWSREAVLYFLLYLLYFNERNPLVQSSLL